MDSGRARSASGALILLGLSALCLVSCGIFVSFGDYDTAQHIAGEGGRRSPRGDGCWRRALRIDARSPATCAELATALVPFGTASAHNSSIVIAQLLEGVPRPPGSWGRSTALMAPEAPPPPPATAMMAPPPQFAPALSESQRMVSAVASTVAFMPASQPAAHTGGTWGSATGPAAPSSAGGRSIVPWLAAGLVGIGLLAAGGVYGGRRYVAARYDRPNASVETSVPGPSADGRGAEVAVDVPALAVVEGETKLVTVTKETSNTKRTIGLVVGGVGVVGLGAAVVTGILILGNKSTADEKCAPTCVDQSGRDAVSAGTTLVPINFIAWGVAALGLGVGSYLVLTSKSKDPTATTTPTAQVAPIVGPGLGGASIVGRF